MKGDVIHAYSYLGYTTVVIWKQLMDKLINIASLTKKMPEKSTPVTDCTCSNNKALVILRK
jgi:hypothetical protein